MMKRIACLLLALPLFSLLLFSSCTLSPGGEPPTETQPQTTAAPPASPETEVRAVWLSYFDLMDSGSGLTESQWRKTYAALFDDIAAYGLDTLFVHVRPFTDAIYPSEIYPWSEILTGTQGKDPGYDPLGILCELAAARGLALHAWLNPFRILSDKRDVTKLDNNNPALPHIEAQDGWVSQANGRWYWNPAAPEAHALIYAGVTELLENYPLAGIHIDDYFYPTQDTAFDAAQYESYKALGGTLALDDWRRELVSQFVAGLYRAVHNASETAVLSVSPAADIEKNADTHYADTVRWMREPGFADWMIPQVYYGFAHETLPFERTAKAWAALERHAGLKLIFGLAAYKIGQEDEYAGSGKTEWQTHDDMLARQLALIRKLPGYSGFAIYSCAGLFRKNLTDIANIEHNNLQLLLIT